MLIEELIPGFILSPVTSMFVFGFVCACVRVHIIHTHKHLGEVLQLKDCHSAGLGRETRKRHTNRQTDGRTERETERETGRHRNTETETCYRNLRDAWPQSTILT